MTTLYCVGFAIDNYNNIALIKKNHPEWQKGLLNGIGGHVEDDESFVEAMVREFEEECGIVTTVNQWKHFARLQSPSWAVWCFVTRDIDVTKVQTLTREQVNWYEIFGNLRSHPTVPNLNWLIPLALQNDPVMEIVVAQYKDGIDG